MRAYEILLEYNREKTAQNLGNKLIDAMMRDRAMMIRVANEWAKIQNLPIKFFDVRDADDELEWLVSIKYS